MSTQRDGARGIAIISGLEGEIQEVLRDDFGLLGQAKPGLTLVDLADINETSKITNCLEELRTSGWITDWEINLPHPPEFITLKFSGMRNGEHLLLVAARSHHELAKLVDDLSPINHELVKAFRAGINGKFKTDQYRTDLEGQHFNELSRLNNELVNLQRQLAQKNAQLHESSERFRSLVENSFLGILVVDKGYRITYVNDRFCQILGYPRDKIVSHDFRKFLDPETAEQLTKVYQAHQNGDPVQDSYAFEIIRPDGEVRHVEITATIIQDLAGNSRTMGQLLDITERKRAEMQLKEAAKATERERLSRELHDSVTQSLHSANLIADSLPTKWEEDPEEGRRGLEYLQRFTHGALAEMRTLLLELNPSALVDQELPVLLRQLSDTMMTRSRAVVTTTVVGVCDVPTDIKFALYRITQEALNNVVKHSEAQRVWVNLQCAELQVTLSIRDDGCGFVSSDTHPAGLGIGIMQSRSQEIEAKLYITSQPDSGTEVLVEWVASGKSESPG